MVMMDLCLLPSSNVSTFSVFILFMQREEKYLEMKSPGSNPAFTLKKNSKNYVFHFVSQIKVLALCTGPLL